MRERNPDRDVVNVTLHWADDNIQSVGRLAYINRVAHFEYADSFRAEGVEISPVRHRVSDRSNTVRPYDTAVFQGLHGVFHDSLPDSWGRLLTDRRASELGIDPMTLSPLDRLKWVGKSGIGALCYEPVNDYWVKNQAALDLNRIAHESQDVLAGHASEVIPELGNLGGSPGGARPKVMVSIDSDDGAIYGSNNLGNQFQHCIVKFRGFNDPFDIANIEKTYSDMATMAGVRTPRTRLIQGVDGTNYFVSYRFDRDGDGRLHTHTASGLLYADFRLPSLDYRDLIALTRALTRDKREVSAMYALAVFNVLVHNRDDHARQFTFSMDRTGTWQLAPAYDLTYSPGPGGEHSTSVLGKGRNIEHEDLIELGKSADLTETESAQVIERTMAAIADWNQIARDNGVAKNSRLRINKAISPN